MAFSDLILEKFSHCECKLCESMARHTTFQIGGPADVVVYPENTQTLSRLIRFCSEYKEPLSILGKGSNVLISDDGIRGVVAILDSRFGKIDLLDETTIHCFAGASMASIGAFACREGLTGFEFAAGIPGTIGGGLYMNAGAYGGELKDVVVSATYLDKSGDSHTVFVTDMQLGYRTSCFSKSECYITEVTLRLQPGNRGEIQAKMNELAHRRLDKQPLNFPSAGSTFKRPEGYFAGALIEQSGLKGYAIGDAQVSEKHAGFVINRGKATAQQVKELIAHIQKIVKRDSGVLLECEVKML